LMTYRAPKRDMMHLPPASSGPVTVPPPGQQRPVHVSRARHQRRRREDLPPADTEQATLAVIQHRLPATPASGSVARPPRPAGAAADDRSPGRHGMHALTGPGTRPITHGMTVTSSEHCRIPVAQRAADMPGSGCMADAPAVCAELGDLGAVTRLTATGGTCSGWMWRAAAVTCAGAWGISCAGARRSPGSGYRR